VAADTPGTSRERMRAAQPAPGRRGRLRGVGIALLPSFTLAIGLLAAAAGVPMLNASAPVVVCVHPYRPCLLPRWALLVTDPARHEREVDEALRQFAESGDRVRLIDDMRSFARRADGRRLRLAVVGFLETPGETQLTRPTTRAILAALETVSGEGPTPTEGLWISDLLPEGLLPRAPGTLEEDRLAAQNAAVVYPQAISYVPVDETAGGGWPAAVGTALLLVGLAMVVCRVFPV
jgi:hypothetical protein